MNDRSHPDGPVKVQTPSEFPATIQTSRLTLRPPRMEDAESVFSAYAQDSEVARYMVWTPHASPETTREFIGNCIAQWNAGAALPYVITSRTDQQLLGMLEARPRGHIVNIGYVLRHTHWGQGLMVEAIRAFTAVALGLPGIFRVEATCDVDNRPSARALEKSGFQQEGRLRHHTRHPNISSEPRDCFIYAACRKQ